MVQNYLLHKGHLHHYRFQQTIANADKNLTAGTYAYRLKQIDYNGNYKYYELQNEVVIGVPNKFVLNQNYPNPFNPSTVLSFQLPVAGFISLKVYDINGREISELVNENLSAGEYKINFNGSALPSGVYYYKLTSDNFSETKKMILIK